MKIKFSKCWAVVLFVFITILLPFYIPNEGYSQIGEDKFLFFLYGMACFILTGIVLALFNFRESAFGKNIFSINVISKSDIFCAGYLVSVLLSFIFSVNKKTALFGNEEWNMGLITQVCLVFLYFVFSRCKIPIKKCVYAVCIAGIPLALLAIFNVFGLHPIPIKAPHPLYVSTIGNINWFCGYFIIIVAMEIMIYFYSEDRKAKILWGTALTISLAALILQSSASGYAALFVLLLILLKPALSDLEKLLNYIEILLFLSGSCTLIYLTGYFAPGAYVIDDPYIDIIVFSPLGFIFWVICMALYIFLQSRMQPLKLQFLHKYIVFSILTIFIGYLTLCILNTANPKITPILNGNGLFTFDRFWWSTRGGTYTVGVQAYLSFPWYRWFIGIGPDCFLSYVYDNMDAIPMAQYFRTQPLANAHNELLTCLINYGLLGAVSYAGLFITNIKNSLKSTNPFVKIITFGILGYIINNFFSFSQILNTPFIFVLLGITENLRKAENS